jgi:hypothetical protein
MRQAEASSETRDATLDTLQWRQNRSVFNRSIFHLFVGEHPANVMPAEQKQGLTFSLGPSRAVMTLAIVSEIGSGLRVIRPVTLRAVGHWASSGSAGRRRGPAPTEDSQALRNQVPVEDSRAPVADSRSTQARDPDNKVLGNMGRSRSSRAQRAPHRPMRRRPHPAATGEINATRTSFRSGFNMILSRL